MKKTGVFYHDVCGKEAYSTLAMGVEEGFESLEKENLFSYPNVMLYESMPPEEKEIENVRKQVPGRVRDFKPELIFWVFGLDTHKASYGTATLTERCYPKLAEIIKETADQVCDGKLIVKTPCNAPGWVTGYVLPRIVDSLAELRKYEEPLV